MIGSIPIDVFNINVAVFASDADRVACLKEEGCDPVEHDIAALASAHMDEKPNGGARFSLVLKPDATKATWAHECSHMADFICHRLGMPISFDATEVRAYLIGHLFAHLEEMLG
jgi:hypothetical protein